MFRHPDCYPRGVPLQSSCYCHGVGWRITHLVHRAHRNLHIPLHPHFSGENRPRKRELNSVRLIRASEYSEAHCLDNLRSADERGRERSSKAIISTTPASPQTKSASPTYLSKSFLTTYSSSFVASISVSIVSSPCRNPTGL